MAVVLQIMTLAEFSLRAAPVLGISERGKGQWGVIRLMHCRTESENFRKRIGFF